MNSIPQNSAHWKDSLIRLCAIWFLFLCFLHFFSQRPLWLDEGYIFDNIHNTTIQQVFSPLRHNQAHPRGYLFLIKVFSESFNYHVLALRFFPFVFMLSAFFVWKKLYRGAFNSGILTLLALLAFSSSYWMVYYAAEFKQYSADVLAIGLFTLYSVYQIKAVREKITPAFILATLGLPLAFFFSHMTFLVFWIVLYNFLFFARKSKGILLLMAGYALLSVLGIVFVYQYDVRYTAGSTNELYVAWGDYFVNTQSVGGFLKTFGEGIKRLSVWWYSGSKAIRQIGTFTIPFFVLSLAGYGISALVRNRGRIGDVSSMGFILFGELFFLGILKKYPFTGARITLFLAPFAFYFVVKGIGFFKGKKPLYIGLISVYAIFLLICSFTTIQTFLKLYQR